MSRLSAALLVAWLGVFAGAAPAFACAAAPAGHCCPDDTTAPCPDSGPAAAPGARACCAANPGPMQFAYGAPARIEQAGQTDREVPELPAVPVPTNAPLPASPLPEPLLSRAGDPARDASRTYLHTLRLRL